MPSRSSDADFRDELISKARYGDLTPEQAEAEAAARGLPPLQREPPEDQFDPLHLPRWSFAMAIAWIASRDLNLVRRQDASFRAECTHWVPQSWKGPIQDGHAFKRYDGWFLETLAKPTIARLALLEIRFRSERTSPHHAMLVGEAQQELWKALSEERLVASAINDKGRPVDIPARDWAYSKIYEERDRDVLKYNALDQKPAFQEITIKRVDLLRLWPPKASDQASGQASEYVVDDAMLAPMLAKGIVGYVPLCCGLHWIMSKGNTRHVTFADQDEWNESVRQLFDHIATGEIELIGLRRGQPSPERIPGHAVSMIRVVPPLHSDIADLPLSAPSHILCMAYVDHKRWSDDLNDKLYESGRGLASSHLQLRKRDVLKQWPRPLAKADRETRCFSWLHEQMVASRNRREKSRKAYLAEAQKKFKGLAERQFARAWDDAIKASGAVEWSKAGRPRGKSNHRSK